MKAASDLTQERLTVVEVSGSDGSSYRHRDELEVTQSTRGGRGGLGDTRADRFGFNSQCFCSDLDLNALTRRVTCGPRIWRGNADTPIPTHTDAEETRWTHSLRARTCAAYVAEPEPPHSSTRALTSNCMIND